MDPDPGGSKTCGPGRSGCLTLQKIMNSITEKFPRHLKIFENIQNFIFNSNQEWGTAFRTKRNNFKKLGNSMRSKECLPEGKRWKSGFGSAAQMLL
jgi:hypothetical protein